MSTSETKDVIVIGAGFSGLAMLHHLRQADLSVALLEASGDVGGTWHLNTYPGVRTDSEFSYYCYYFSKEIADEWSWSERYPSGAEVYRYLRFAADRLGLRPHIQLNTPVQQLKWDQARSLWQVTSANGDSYDCRHVVSAVGLLSAPTTPALPGIDEFDGQKVHTSRWPEGLDLTGKRVGIVGVGSSGIQVIPEIAPIVERLTVFQRTPNYVVPTSNRRVLPMEMDDVRDQQQQIKNACLQNPFGVPMPPPTANVATSTPEELQAALAGPWREGGFHFITETLQDLNIDDEAANLASEFVREQIQDVVDDPETAESLTPRTYPIGAKRVPTGHNYYETFNRSNVDLVDTRKTPIVSLRSGGVELSDRFVDLDVIIFATGFEAMTGSLNKIDIQGSEDRSLKQVWQDDGLRTTLGMMVAGFPNFFMMLGPQTPGGNLPPVLQFQAQWIADLIEWTNEAEVPVVEASLASDMGWVEMSHEAVEPTVMHRYAKQARAWFYGGNVDGRRLEINTYFGGVPAYVTEANGLAATSYEALVPSEA